MSASHFVTANDVKQSQAPCYHLLSRGRLRPHFLTANDVKQSQAAGYILLSHGQQRPTFVTANEVKQSPASCYIQLSPGQQRPTFVTANEVKQSQAACYHLLSHGRLVTPRDLNDTLRSLTKRDANNCIPMFVVYLFWVISANAPLNKPSPQSAPWRPGSFPLHLRQTWRTFPFRCPSHGLW